MLFLFPLIVLASLRTLALRSHVKKKKKNLKTKVKITIQFIPLVRIKHHLEQKDWKGHAGCVTCESIVSLYVHLNHFAGFVPCSPTTDPARVQDPAAHRAGETSGEY